MTERVRFATRINSFASDAGAYWPGLTGKPAVLQLVERAATARGLTDLDLNYPDHLGGSGAEEMTRRIRELGLNVSGYAMRYYSNPAFKAGAFTNPDPAVRQDAIDLTKRGIDAAAESGAPLMTLWLGQDGFDYSFQADYAQLWDWEIAGIAAVAAHNPAVAISLEYKPNEPRAFSLLPDAATTLLAIKEVGLPNVGVTIDFAHSLYADEQPACAAALVSRYSRLLGVHLNDGYAKRDDGLMVGSVHALQTVELLRQIRRDGFDGPIYFDTFPDVTGLDPVRECEVNIATVRAMLAAVDRIEAENALAEATSRQDAVGAQAIVQRAIFGAD